jgi:hypothetical protein
MPEPQPVSGGSSGSVTARRLPVINRFAMSQSLRGGLSLSDTLRVTNDLPHLSGLRMKAYQ